MINKIRLKNFYSYEDHTFDLHPGINVFCGNSRSGKTTVRRGIEWVHKNRPVGLSYVSWWNRKGKNELIDDTLVEIELDATAIERLRNNEFNGYLRDGKAIAGAIGTQSAPDQVIEAFNFSELNLQKQFDAPFMLSESASEVARFFNSTIRLDVIDTVLSKAEAKRRSTNQEIERNKKQIEQYDKELDSYTWIVKAEKLIERTGGLETTISERKIEREALIDFLEKIEQYETVLKGLPDNIEDVENLIEKALSLNDQIDRKVKEANELDMMLQSIDAYEKEIAGYDKIDFVGVNRMVEQAVSLNDKIETRKNEQRDLFYMMENIGLTNFAVEKYDYEIMELESKIKEFNICPTCMRSL